MEHRAADLLSNLAVTIPSLRSEVGTLSGGQRQQVAVARSLLGEPKVVLLDEPTAALGVAADRQVLALIKRLRERGLGVVVISHNLADVFEVADRIFVLRLGRPAGDFSAERDDRGARRRRDHRARRRRPSARAEVAEDERKPPRRPRESEHERTPTDAPQVRREKSRLGPRQTLRRLIQGDLASLRVVLGLVADLGDLPGSGTAASSRPRT